MNSVSSSFRPIPYLTLFCVLFFTASSLSETEQLHLHEVQDESNSTSSWDNISNHEAYLHLNQQLESLDENFVTHFLGYFHVQKSRLLQALNDESMAPDLKIPNIKQNPGNYLVLLAKMYLYEMLPKSQLTGFTWSLYKSESRYMLAYFYLKVAAQRYENAQAYYYLAVLDYYKLNPHQTVIRNLQKEASAVQTNQWMNEWQGNQLLEHLRNQRFISVQQNLFLSSMVGHHGAAIALASLYKEGVGLYKNYKNCTAALGYYLSVVKDTYVDHYQFRTAYSDDHNLQKQLYAKRKLHFENHQNAHVVSDTEFFDSETIKAIHELADNYFVGKNGFNKNYPKAAQLYAKLAAQDHKTSMSMLAMCYFKGQGVPLDRKRARLLFEHSNKYSLSEAMLIVMDYFEIQSKGQRTQAIAKMKQIYDKKKDNMNSILKYLFASLILKGDVPTLKADDAILLMGSAAKEGHLMAKISMGLLFADGIDVNYDCAKAVGYFYEEASSHPFFMDKFYSARFGLKQELFTFSLIKYLELSIIGDTNSYINALYIVEIEQEKSLGMGIKSWSLKAAAENTLYQRLKREKIVPDISSFFQKEFSFIGKRPIKFSTLQKLFESDPEVIQQHSNYIKKKIIKVCAVTKDNSLMHFYDYKINQKQQISRLNAIANGSPAKLHVLESRYLLGQIYHNRAFKAKESGKDYTKDQYTALQEYKRAVTSPILGKILFYFEEILLNPEGIDFEDELFQFGFVNDFLTFTFVLSIVIFVLYYKRSKKLDEIHRKQLQKRNQQKKAKDEEEWNRKLRNSSNDMLSEQKQENSEQKEMELGEQERVEQGDESQPQILEQRPISGYRIGSSLEEEDNLVLREYEEYRFEESEGKMEQTEQEGVEEQKMKKKEE